MVNGSKTGKCDAREENEASLYKQRKGYTQHTCVGHPVAGAWMDDG